MTEDKDIHVTLRIPLDADNVTMITDKGIRDKVVFMNVGPAEEAMIKITHTLDNPGMGVMMREEAEE